MNAPILQLKDALHNIPDPRPKQGVSHPFTGILALVILGLTARQIYMTPIHLLNLFVHDLGIVLAQYSVKEEKTNEGSCLRKHAKEFFAKYPFAQLFTGDAIFASRPLLRVLKELNKDYIFCVKENQETILESMVQTFAGVDWDKPDFQEQSEHKYCKHEKKEAA
jgi:hypothetical protein